MGSLGDDDGAKTPTKTSSNVGSSDSDTHFFDSQSWSPEFRGEEVKSGYDDESSKSTMLKDDTVIYEETFETQFLDLPGETQVMDSDGEAEDLVGETQVMDFYSEAQFADIGGETQVLDDVNCTEHMGTQPLDATDSDNVSDADSEVSDSTEVLSDNDDTAKKSCDQLGDTQKVRCSSASEDNEKGSMEQPDATSDEKKNSGSGLIRFTSVRAASLRASGLAARNTTLKGKKRVSSSLQTSNQSVEKFDVTGNAASTVETGKESEQELALGRYDGIMNSSRNDNICRGGNLAARKLFDGNVENENEELPHDTTREFPSCDVVGLSYIGSQEPGDLSQANALDFVDRFVKQSIEEFHKEVDPGKCTRGQSLCPSSAKGPQELAKKVNEKSIAGELGIYDWDDSREDEGGGDIFCRRKEDLLGSSSVGRRSLNPKVKGMQDGNGRRIDVFNSDSKLLSRKLKVTDKAICEARRKAKRNLVTDLSSQPDIILQDKQLEKNAAKTGVPEMLDVGIDTQMAAEAMEALFHGGDIANLDVNDVCQDVKTAACKATKQPSSRKRAGLNDVSVASRLSKKTRRVDSILDMTSVSSAKPSRNVRKRSEVKVVTPKSKKTKETARAKLNANGSKNLDRQRMQEKVSRSEPIAHRTRRSLEFIAHQTRLSATASHLENADNKCRDRGTRASKMLASDLSKGFKKLAAPTDSKTVNVLSCPKRRRSLRNLSRQVNKSDNIDDPLAPYVHPEAIQTRTSHRSCRQTRSSINQALDGKVSPQRSGRIVSDNAESVENSARLDDSPREKSEPSNSMCTTPVNCKIAINDTSPICMGDEYFKQAHERSSKEKSVIREICKLSATVPLPKSPAKDLRKRREFTDVQVLYSNHLDDGIIKQQKKILARLGVSVASSIADSTHFIADQFVRTRNMLEAIASGKPVVTHLWLESCGQANCFIDEKNYILRDAKKEKEFGFIMSKSLACASRHPLLQGLRVLVTPNTKPGRETISSLVKAVQGEAVERIGRSVLKDGAFPDDLLVLSCEEDYPICVPFLEQGATIYSSELLLNGIVTQKLEYDRYQLFTDHVRKTRSSIWLKKDGTKFVPVAKSRKD